MVKKLTSSKSSETLSSTENRKALVEAITLATQELENTEKDLTVDEKIAIGKSELQEKIAKKIINTFLIVDLVVLIVILCSMYLDQQNIATSGYNPIFTSKVLMALIAGTVVQLGTISLTLSKWLFPKDD